MDIDAAASHARFLNDTLALAQEAFNAQIDAKLRAIPPVNRPEFVGGLLV